MKSSYSKFSDQELIIKCRKDDYKAQEALYKRFYAYAMGISLRYCINRDDALEAVNDSFIKLFKTIKTFEDHRLIKPWFRQIVVNSSIDNRRKNLKHSAALDIEYADEKPTDFNAIAKINAEDILKLLDCLPEIHKVVFNLYEIDGYSHEEIADILDIPSSSSRVYLSRAKDKLRKLVNSRFLDHERAV
ncbi:RNA polymerase, sigma-24 subunit, ECF subfamily [Pseudopedobacter saltans DSM 12145]|uniref:RNA polymerase, sigma-24 subunit, ECF subfamily n=1 Tax=Pseudopedobacter saltans (strain ATCC 51119 / DSM 12145 / JCM 21818 / CCUG 39354 / LMG 10337 / NBRC 100064 / NCIMB 13643) TaxID=762903 RepID=F0SB28_PSESL|nr:sigma-70 family RNA polymerase sigma factor [Pseudopedobacter saltans]ADY52663.1 RNA polymerase, sigma-24 subunit, ECF subfamily [Pseudopedobacter saltans DSM 12145]